MNARAAISSACAAACIGVLCSAHARAQSAVGVPSAPLPAQPADTPAEAPSEDALPAEHVPSARHTLEPGPAINVGERVRLTVRAEVPVGDDVTVPEQSFAPFELVGKQARVEPEKNGRQSFVFVLDLIGLTPGDQALSALELRAVTSDGQVGTSTLPAIAIKVRSLLANEPNAALKEPTKPITVMQDDYTLAYVAGGLLGALLIAGLTLLVLRYLQRRVRPAPPPPPPRPAWEVALEKLGALRRRKAEMLTAGQGGRFVDEASDIIRELLGGTFGFTGLDTTSEEMLALLRRVSATAELRLEVQSLLGRCDLVKFAKVEPDEGEVELVLAKAQGVLELSVPRTQLTPTSSAPATAASSEPSKPEATP